MSNPNTRKSCVVPKCKNTTTNSPEKLFFIVPKDVKMRKKWIKAMKRLDPFGDKSTVYCCEDHFDGSRVLPIYRTYTPLYEDDIYVLLQINKKNDGSFVYDLHIWVGANAYEADVMHAERCAATFDLRLRRRTTMHWERQHQECDVFLNHFSPAVHYRSGKYPNITHIAEMEQPEATEKQLLCAYIQRNRIKVKQVKCEISSLNHGDAFILDTDEAAYVLGRGNWNPIVLSRIGNQISFRRYLQDFSKEVDVVILDKDATTDNWDHFYKILGWEDMESSPTIPDGVEEKVPESRGAPQLYEILRNRRGRVYFKNMPFPLRKCVLDSKSLYILINGKDDICLWIGKKNQDRNKAKLYGLTKLHEFASRQMPHSKWPPWNHMTITPEDLEPLSFKQHFYDWLE